MLTMRPQRRSIIPSTTAFISMMWVIMLFCTAWCHSSSFQSRKSPAGGPPELVMRMSGLVQADSTRLAPLAGRDVRHHGR